MNVAAAFPADLSTLATARRFVLSVLDSARLPDEVVDAAVLVANELAANAAIHAGGDALTIRISWREDLLRIEVDDCDDRLPVDEPWSGPSEASGLNVVAAYSSAWGVERKGRGKTVWVELRVDRAASS